MLGKLFNLGTGSAAGDSIPVQGASSRPVSSLESVQEDVHTRNLLFPDPQDLYEHRLNNVFPLSSGSGSSLPAGSSVSTFDYNSDVELDTRDVRVIIMQDAFSSAAACLLYDSLTPPPIPTSSFDRPSTTAGTSQLAFQEARRTTTTSPRKPSLTSQRAAVIQPDSPQPRQSAFDRRPSAQGRSQPRVENEAQRAWREYREELATLSSCIFGNSELMAYKGTSTKVHVVPSEPRLADFPSSMFGDGRGSVGRSAMKSSRLSQSFSSEKTSPFHALPPRGAGNRRKKILITRLFPVTLPTEEESVVSPARFSEDSTGYPFPQAGDDTKSKKKPPQVKQKKTPMYAVALVVNLPQISSTSTSATASRSGFQGSSSYTEQASFSSSFGSTRPSGWATIGPGAQGLDTFESSFSGDVEDRMDAITQHWDVIMRTLTRLQCVVAAALYTMLRQIDLASPDPLPPSMMSVTSQQPGKAAPSLGKRGDEGVPAKPPKTNAKTVTLMPNCLAENRHIMAEVDNARARIVAGLRAHRVVTGQNRWPIWREEARWVAKWAGGREEGFFFFNLLTGFLATHTDWLRALGPPPYRQRHSDRQTAKADEDPCMQARTIIVANDKMSARRLIFLLAAFLPASQPLFGVRTHRPSTSASVSGFSQSPPSFIVPILKEESLRRKINRRTGPRRPSHSRNVSTQSQSTRTGGVPTPLAHLILEGSRHDRRASDAASIRTTNLAIPGGDLTTRKSSAATTTTITPETSVPHFSIAHRVETFSQGRSESSGSIAAEDLKRLTRDDSMGTHSMASTDSRQSSGWGSVISNLWTARRRDSTHTTIQSASGSAGISSPTKPDANVVPEADMTQSPVREQAEGVSTTEPDTIDPLTPRQFPDDSTQTPRDPPERLRKPRTPDPSGAFESPVKTSINIDDGVIDVDVPFPEYMASFETAVSSPSSSGVLSTPGFGTTFDAFEQACRVSVDGDAPLNVAGWLQHYHPDFVLQALPAPQNNLVEQVKASMRAEPTPPMPSIQARSPGAPTDRVVDMGMALIADATNFSITRIRHRRVLKRKVSAVGPTISGASAVAVTSPYSEAQGTQDEFFEEPIVVLDEVLAEAVERVIAIGTGALGGSSGSSSRSASNRRGRSNSASTHSLSEPQAAPAPPREVPRSQCKTVILTALEDIVHEVIQMRERGDLAAADIESESVLREAVRTWLDVVDSAE